MFNREVYGLCEDMECFEALMAYVGRWRAEKDEIIKDVRHEGDGKLGPEDPLHRCRQ